MPRDDGGTERVRSESPPSTRQHRPRETSPVSWPIVSLRLVTNRYGPLADRQAQVAVDRIRTDYGREVLGGVDGDGMGRRHRAARKLLSVVRAPQHVATQPTDHVATAGAAPLPSRSHCVISDRRLGGRKDRPTGHSMQDPHSTGQMLGRAPSAGQRTSAK
jgi:hypothetical protein